jgi:hypothetical protein
VASRIVSRIFVGRSHTFVRPQDLLRRSAASISKQTPRRYNGIYSAKIMAYWDAAYKLRLPVQQLSTGVLQIRRWMGGFPASI